MGANCLNENGKRYVVDRSVVHPNYRQHNFNSYIALVKVKDEIDFNDRVQPIPYASQEFPDNVNASYTEWNLVEVSVFILHLSKCKERRKTEKRYFSSPTI